VGGGGVASYPFHTKRIFLSGVTSFLGKRKGYVQTKKGVFKEECASLFVLHRGEKTLKFPPPFERGKGETLHERGGRIITEGTVFLPLRRLRRGVSRKSSLSIRERRKKLETGECVGGLRQKRGGHHGESSLTWGEEGKGMDQSPKRNLSEKKIARILGKSEQIPFTRGGRKGGKGGRGSGKKERKIFKGSSGKRTTNLCGKKKRKGEGSGPFREESPFLIRPS